MDTAQLKVSEFIESLSEGKLPSDSVIDFFKTSVEGKMDERLYPTPILVILDQLSEWVFSNNENAGKLYTKVLEMVSDRIYTIDVNFYMRYFLTIIRIKQSKLDHFESIFMLDDLTRDHEKMNNPIFQSELVSFYLSTILKIYRDNDDYRKAEHSFSDESLSEEMAKISDELKKINVIKATLNSENARSILHLA